MSVSILPTIQTQMNFYAYIILMPIGIIGNIFIYILFTRQRQNACSIYLMHSALANLLFLASNGFFKIFSVTYYEDTLNALVSCKFSIYTPAYFGQVTKTILILACIDRYMITSDRARFRAFSTPKRAKYFIIFSYIFWLIASSHIVIWTTISNGQCTRVGIYATIFTFYIILFVGLSPSIILCVFGYLTFRNMRQVRRRIQPNAQNTSHFLQRRDRDLLILVIAEALFYIITTSLFPAVLLETTISSYLIPNKNLQYFLAEIFTLNVSYLLLFIYSAAPFFIYIISSAAFRRDFKQLIMNHCQVVTRQQFEQTILRVGPKVTQHDTRI